MTVVLLGMRKRSKRKGAKALLNERVEGGKGDVRVTVIARKKKGRVRETITDGLRDTCASIEMTRQRNRRGDWETVWRDFSRKG